MAQFKKPLVTILVPVLVHISWILGRGFYLEYKQVFAKLSTKMLHQEYKFMDFSFLRYWFFFLWYETHISYPTDMGHREMRTLEPVAIIDLRKFKNSIEEVVVFISHYRFEMFISFYACPWFSVLKTLLVTVCSLSLSD